MWGAALSSRSEPRPRAACRTRDRIAVRWYQGAGRRAPTPPFRVERTSPPAVVEHQFEWRNRIRFREPCSQAAQREISAVRRNLSLESSDDSGSWISVLINTNNNPNQQL